MYPVPHDHRGYGYGHGLRVDVSVPLATYALVREPVNPRPVVADLSCGNGMIARRAVAPWVDQPWQPHVLLGDLAPDPSHQFHGPIEQTIGQLGDHLHGIDVDRADLFILSETIEHLDDPDSVLRDVRRVAWQLLLSTPIGETGQGNPEHLWGWDQDGVAAMLEEAGWDVSSAQRIDVLLPDTYSYQVWLVR